jgi:hypothetical protein
MLHSNLCGSFIKAQTQGRDGHNPIYAKGPSCTACMNKFAVYDLCAPDRRWFVVSIFKPVLYCTQAVLHQFKNHVVQVARNVWEGEAGVAIDRHVGCSAVLTHADAARVIDGVLGDLVGANDSRGTGSVAIPQNVNARVLYVCWCEIRRRIDGMLYNIPDGLAGKRRG